MKNTNDHHHIYVHRVVSLPFLITKHFFCLMWFIICTLRYVLKYALNVDFLNLWQRGEGGPMNLYLFVCLFLHLFVCLYVYHTVFSESAETPYQFSSVHLFVCPSTHLLVPLLICNAHYLSIDYHFFLILFV